MHTWRVYNINIQCSMRPVINLLSHFITLRNRPTTLLVSTTGDTGPAAVSAVNDAANPLLTILVHYPAGQISDFQRKQLTTVDSKYVKIASFEGGGDDMDLPIKETLLMNAQEGDDGNANDTRAFCGINSYNIGRPLVQMCHCRVTKVSYTATCIICLICRMYPLTNAFMKIVQLIWFFRLAPWAT